jgi:thioredoxin 1
MSALHLTDASFEREVLEADIPVLVEFWGSWCPPCKMMDPLLAELATDYEGRIKVGKINADQNPRAAARYTVQGVPTFIIFDAGEVKGQRVGAQSRSQLEELIKEVQVLGPLSEEAGPIASELQAAEENNDDERILEHLRALGYVD